MQKLNYNWNIFSVNDSWKEELDRTNTNTFDVYKEILKEISGHRKIKRIKAWCSFYDLSFENKPEFEEDNVTLLKRRKSLCFCKWDEYIIAETDVNNIKSIIFSKVYEDNKDTYFIICIKENTGFYWKYEIII